MATTSKPVVTSPIEAQTLQVFRELLTELGSHRAAQSVTLDSALDRDLGLGSLERVELLVRLEARFDTRLPEELAQQAETPSDWVRAISAGPRVASLRDRYTIIQPAEDPPPAPQAATTWPQVLSYFAHSVPDRVQIHLLEEESGHDISYGELFQTASQVAAGLAASDLGRDYTVAIMLPTSADFFYAFFGVMLAGGIPVPIYPPSRPDKIEEYVRRQVGILRNAEVRFLITFDRVRSVSKIMRLHLPTLAVVTTVDSLRAEGGRAKVPHVRPADTAFIQYTSGSTGDPKGVVLSQSNVLANVRGIGHSVHFRPTDLVVSWLPLYHDMGLIGSWLFSVYFGAPITILSPLSFLSRPERWLWAMHDSRATLCPAPNFSYELCARKIPDSALVGLDLSAWRVAINAGEAVLPETLERFEARFKPYGFRAESFVPCYGLAESSVALAFPPIDRRPVIDTIERDAYEAEGRAVPVPPEVAAGARVLRFVANGRPMPQHEIKIVGEDGQPVGERTQGRLLFRGLSRTSGYFHNPQATSAVIDADGWMDSGDLAYWANGEIYVTGRRKDCIIKSGRNIIPQEVEAAAAEVRGVRRGCVAAFGTRDGATGTERLLVVAETRAVAAEERQRIEAEVVERIDAVLGIPPDKVVLVPPQSIPKTSSGKIRRNETRSLYESGRLGAGARAPWQQILRLWLRSRGAALELAAERIAAACKRGTVAGLGATAAALAGGLSRLLPTAPLRRRCIAIGARALLRMQGHSVRLEGQESLRYTASAVYLITRQSPFDVLAIAASLQRPFYMAEQGLLEGLPAGGAFLLRPLLLPPLAGLAQPQGGTLRERLLQALKNGQSLAGFAEVAPGTPPALSRFRLDYFFAASACARPLVPALIQERKQDGQAASLFTVRLAAPLPAASASHEEMIALREKVRMELGNMAGSQAGASEKAG
jgi:fatty-acyl-CoA synthase